MSLRLRKNELCPIHHSRFCSCHPQVTSARASEQKKGWTKIGPGLFRIDDPNHPRGYRERRSKAEMRKLLLRKVEAQRGKCALCYVAFSTIEEVAPDHIEPRSAGGARRDDHPSNIQAVHHFPCNIDKGSQRIPPREELPEMPDPITEAVQ